MECKKIGQLKKEARQKLKGKWGTAVLVCFLASLITGGLSIIVEITNLEYLLNGNLIANLTNPDYMAEQPAGISVLSNLSTLITLLIGGSISYGLSGFFLNLIRDKKAQVENLFYGFKYFGKNFLIQLIIGIFSFLWSLVVLLPVIIVTIIIFVASFSNYSNLTDFEQLPSSGVIGAIIPTALLFIIASIIISILLFRYALAYYIYYDSKEAAVMDCINGSKELMRGHKVRLFLLNLSFIGWHFLALLTLGIGYLWLTPYISATMASFYNDLKGEEQTESTNLEGQLWNNGEI